MNAMWISLIIEVILELSRRNGTEQQATAIVSAVTAASQAGKNPEAAMTAVMANPDAKKSLITTLADIVGGVLKLFSGGK